MLEESGSRYALAVSIVAHVAMIATTSMVAAREPVQLGEPLPVETHVDEADDALSGNTFDIDGLVDDDRLGNSAQDPPAPPPPAAPAVAPRPSPPATERAAPAAPAAVKTPRPAPAAPARSAAPAASTAASDAASGATSGRRYGAAGQSRGVRDFARAFTRAMPAAISSDAAWADLPLGHVGRIELKVMVDADAKIVRYELLPKDASAPLRRIAERTMPLLTGEFALSGADGPGEETVRIDVTLSRREPISDLELGHDAPAADRSGRAYFTLASGRHFEATIVLLKVENGSTDGSGQ